MAVMLASWGDIAHRIHLR